MRYLAKAGLRSRTPTSRGATQSGADQVLHRADDRETRQYFRPNLFAQHPRHPHAYLQHAGVGIRGAAAARDYARGQLRYLQRVRARRGQAIPGTEEYADSEKYQFAPGLGPPRNIAELVCQSTRSAARIARCSSTHR